MGAHYICKDVCSLYPEPVRLYCRFDIDPGVGINTFGGKGIANVAWIAAGNVTITLADRYTALLCVHAVQQAAGNVDDLYAQLEAEAVNTAGGGTITLRLKTAAVNTDPTLINDDIWVVIDLLKSGTL